MNTQDEKMMRLALGLARRGLGKVEPNPAVGAIITKAGQVIGKGWHQTFGEAHAEVNAIEDCQNLGANPQGGTLYVTLEPCCHHGKTGPCTEAVIKAGLSRVVVATRDPAAHANGAGLHYLGEAGLSVEVGLCELEARLLNAPFFKFSATGKTWIVLKWAQSLDGYLSRTDTPPDDIWISNKRSRSDAHRLRRRSQAILVGINTVVEDNPQLTPRPSQGKKPLRLVLDNQLRIPLGCRLLRSASKTPTVVVTTETSATQQAKQVNLIRNKGADVWICPNSLVSNNLSYVIEKLSERGIQQLLVEGGPTVLSAFIKASLVDEICYYTAPCVLGSHGNKNLYYSISQLDRCLRLDSLEAKSFGNDVRLTALSTTSTQLIASL